MRMSERLFVPSLNLWWKWEATNFLLIQGRGPKGTNPVIWESVTGAPSWDYIGANCMAKILQSYLNTPVEALKKKDLEHIVKEGYFYEQAVKDNVAMLARLLLAADRRIGKNLQSIWLFTEPEIEVRNLIGSRV